MNIERRLSVLSICQLTFWCTGTSKTLGIDISSPVDMLIVFADVAVARAKSMPVTDQQDQNLLRGSLQRSTTENRRFKKNIDNANVRVVAEAKLSDRKKVQIHL
jgi:hypothetical protein